MPAPTKRQLANSQNLGKARDSVANKRKEDHQEALDAINEENRQLRAELQHEKTLKTELRAALSRAEKRVELSSELPHLPHLGKGQALCEKSKAIVCRVLQFARNYCGQHAVEWTSYVTGIKRLAKESFASVLWPLFTLTFKTYRRRLK